MGRKGAMLLALSLFGSGTVFCGFAPSMKTLIAARAVAGMGGGGVMTVASIAVSDLIPLNQRGLYQGIANILYGLGAGLGGPLGGWVNDRFGWRAAFQMQAPVLVFSMVLVAIKVNVVLPDEVQHRTLADRLRRIDFLGSLTLVTTVGTFLLAFSLKASEEMSWSHPLIYGLLIASVISMMFFVLVEKYLAPYPVMPIRLITQRTPLAVSIVNLLGSITAFSMIYNVPLYFSAVRLESATEAGARLLPHSIAIPVGSVFAGWLMRKTGKLHALTLLSSVMSIIANLLVASWNEKTPAIRYWLDLIPQALGMASVITTTLIAMIASVYKEDMAVAIGITYLFRTTGQVLGVSLGGAVLQAVLAKNLQQQITGPNAAENIYIIRHKIEVIPSLPPPLRRVAVNSYAEAIRVVFIWQTAMSVLGLIACLPIQENPLSIPQSQGHESEDCNQLIDSQEDGQ
ncbi:hypothetical protein AX15_002499 [Amanita polypyramis BW_CC]|nr:hypothetical protein AX15_002499 [Amanita polypyramis BW_CC]